jgi:hypothetical protein
MGVACVKAFWGDRGHESNQPLFLSSPPDGNEFGVMDD